MTSNISTPPIGLATDFDEIDRAITRLCSHREQWAQTTIPQRLIYLQDCLDRTIAVAEAWTNAACEAKGIDPQSPLAGEELMAGAIATVRNLRLLMTTLQANGQLKPSKITRREDGQFLEDDAHVAPGAGKIAHPFGRGVAIGTVRFLRVLPRLPAVFRSMNQGRTGFAQRLELLP